MKSLLQGMETWYLWEDPACLSSCIMHLNLILRFLYVVLEQSSDKVCLPLHHHHRLSCCCWGTRDVPCAVMDFFPYYFLILKTPLKFYD